MQRAIYAYLKKYYVHFNDAKHRKILKSKTDDETYETFKQLWRNEHGGMYRIDLPFTPPENLPYYKDGCIVITDTGSNSIKFHKAYIKTLNDLILANESPTLNLNFSNNFGGKPQVMIAGLLPIFNNFNTVILSYYYDKNKKRHYDVKRSGNKIICTSNNGASSIGTRKAANIRELNIYYNNITASSAEQSIICLLSLRKHTKVNLIGDKSAGYTSVNKYIKLSDKYGIEIPIGYMGTATKIFYNGIIQPADK